MRMRKKEEECCSSNLIHLLWSNAFFLLFVIGSDPDQVGDDVTTDLAADKPIFSI